MSYRTALGACLLALFAGVGSAAAANPDRSAAEQRAYTTWYRLALELVRRTPGYAPPVASRTFAYLGITLYEALAPDLPAARSLAGQLDGFPGVPPRDPGKTYDAAVVAHAALARQTALLFENTGPSGQNALATTEARLGAELAAGLAPDVLERSLAQGRAAADAVHAWSRGDGGADGTSRLYPTDFEPPRGAAFWVSPSQIESRPLLPYWGRNRPFALRAGDECPAPAPVAYAEALGSPFRADALEVLRVARSLTPEQADVARFWSDDPMLSSTPAGHWIAILGQVLAERRASLGLAAEAYARLGMALADAFIGCWSAKYRYNLLRPDTYIRRLLDPSFEALLPTPPFPEYPSGHSVVSAAAAEALTSLFGEDYRFTDHSKQGDGLAARTFRSFREAASEAGISRLYGGIHFRAAIERGLEQGRCIGSKVARLRFRY